MRCHYLSDLHLESQNVDVSFPKGDLLILAGDLCHARCLDPGLDRGPTDRYAADQRGRVHRFLDAARANFAHVLLVAGNHEFYDGIFEDTPALLRRHLDRVTVLDNETVEIGGMRFFGSTFWTDFDGRSSDALDAVRRRMGEYFFVKCHRGVPASPLTRFRPEDAWQAHEAARAALLTAVAASPKPLVVITHHAPSRQGLNPTFAGNGLDPAYASGLDEMIAGFDNVPVWVHGHTHIVRSYQIGRTDVHTNAPGLARERGVVRKITARWFDLD